MAEMDRFKEALRKVRVRLSPEDFGNMRIDEVIAEVWNKLERPAAEQKPSCNKKCKS